MSDRVVRADQVEHVPGSWVRWPTTPRLDRVALVGAALPLLALLGWSTEPGHRDLFLKLRTKSSLDWMMVARLA